MNHLSVNMQEQRDMKKIIQAIQDNQKKINLISNNKNMNLINNKNESNSIFYVDKDLLYLEANRINHKYGKEVLTTTDLQDFFGIAKENARRLIYESILPSFYFTQKRKGITPLNLVIWSLTVPTAQILQPCSFQVK